MRNDTFVGEVSMLELTSKILNVDIYILEGTIPVPSKKFADECEELYVNNKVIVLYTIDGIKYHLVAHRKGKEYYYLFDSSSSFITKLYEIICGRTTPPS